MTAVLLEVWNENFGPDDLIGSVTVPLAEYIVDSNERENRAEKSFVLEGGGVLNCTIIVEPSVERELTNDQLLMTDPAGDDEEHAERQDEETYGTQVRALSAAHQPVSGS